MSDYKYDLPEATIKGIIEYCYSRMKLVKRKKLEEFNISHCDFLELIFDRAVRNLKLFGVMDVGEFEVMEIFTILKNTEKIFDDYSQNKLELYGVKDDGTLVFKAKLANKTNE